MDYLVENTAWKYTRGTLHEQFHQMKNIWKMRHILTNLNTQGPKTPVQWTFVD